MVCVGLLVHRIHILLVLESKTKNNNMRKKSEIISRDHRLPTSPIYKILCKKSLIKSVSQIVFSIWTHLILCPNSTCNVHYLRIEYSLPPNICRYVNSTETERVMIIFINLIFSWNFNACDVYRQTKIF